MAFESGRFEEAKSALQAALTLVPSFGAATAMLAEVAFEESRFEDVIVLSSKAIKNGQDRSKMLVLAGDAHLNLSQPIKALEAYGKAAKLRPKDDAIQRRIARAERGL